MSRGPPRSGPTQGIWLRPQFAPFPCHFVSFLPLVQTAADQSFCSEKVPIRNAALTHPWTYFLPWAIHDIFLPLLCEANGRENHRRDVNVLPGGSLQNIHLWTVLLRSCQASNRVNIKKYFLFSIFKLDFWCSRDILVAYLGVFCVVLQCCGTFSCLWPWGHVSVQHTNIYSPPTFPELRSLCRVTITSLLYSTKLSMHSFTEIALPKFPPCTMCSAHL